MKKSNRLPLRLQTWSFKNTFFQLNHQTFKALLPDSLIEAIHQSGDVRNTAHSEFFFRNSALQALVKKRLATYID